jgi:AraC family transcriptional regulator
VRPRAVFAAQNRASTWKERHTAVDARQGARMTTSPNQLQELSLLPQSFVDRWHGLPLAWVEAKPFSLVRNICAQRPHLATLDVGSGEAEIAFSSNTERLDVSAGAIGLFVPGERRHIRWRCHSARRILVDLDMRFLAEHGLVSDEMLSTRFKQDLEFRDPELSLLLRAMVGEVASGCPNGRLFAESLSLGLASRLVRSHGSRAAHDRERGRLTSAQLTRLNDLIESRLDGSISLGILSKATGFSAPHLVRLMRNTVQCTPHQYVLQRRVKRALWLLQETDMTIAAVAASTGFSSQSHLTSTMARIDGRTPGAVRRMRAL